MCHVNSGGYGDISEDDHEVERLSEQPGGMRRLYLMAAKLSAGRRQRETLARVCWTKAAWERNNIQPRKDTTMMNRVKFTPEMADMISERLVHMGLTLSEVHRALVLWNDSLLPQTARDQVAFEVFAVVQDQVDQGS